MSASKFLIVNADEFGLTEGVNRGIIEGHQHGIITNTTMITNMWAFDDAVALAGANPNLATGVHLNLTDGAPVLPSETVSSLVDSDGLFYGRSRLVRRLLTGKIRMEEVRAELGAQVAKAASAGINLSHLDSHQSSFMFPTVLRAVLDIAVERRLPIRLPQEQIMFSSKRALIRHMPSPRLWKKAAMWSICQVARRQLQLRGVKTVRRVVSTIGTFEQSGVNSIDIGTYHLVLNSLQPGISELMVHPGYTDKALASFTWGGWPEAKRREDELAILCDSRLPEMLRSKGIELTDYRSLRDSDFGKTTR